LSREFAIEIILKAFSKNDDQKSDIIAIFAVSTMLKTLRLRQKNRAVPQGLAISVQALVENAYKISLAEVCAVCQAFLTKQVKAPLKSAKAPGARWWALVHFVGKADLH
jgi:hypothetical protein